MTLSSLLADGATFTQQVVPSHYIFATAGLQHTPPLSDQLDLRKAFTLLSSTFFSPYAFLCFHMIRLSLSLNFLTHSCHTLVGQRIAPLNASSKRQYELAIKEITILETAHIDCHITSIWIASEQCSSFLIACTSRRCFQNEPTTRVLTIVRTMCIDVYRSPLQTVSH